MAGTPLDVPFGRPAGERSLHFGASIVALLVVFAGFAPTYFLKGVFNGPELSTLKHAHGIVMTAWFTLFLVQARLIASAIVMRKRGPYHKRFMLLASLAILTPAFARLPFDFIVKGGPPAFFALTDLVILDRAPGGRRHAAADGSRQLACLVTGPQCRLKY
ncbi:MAG: hypothetical protein ACXWF2_15115 [Usitatibacter sp.]